MKNMPWGLASLGRALALLPSLVVFAVLGGLFYWGHHYHWKVPTFAELFGSAHAEEPAAGGGAPEIIALDNSEDLGQAALYRIRLRSAETARKSGIKTEPAGAQRVAQHILASAVLDYDQTRYAELSSRAPGSVWAVEKVEGDWVQKGDVLALVAAEALGQAKSDFLQALVEEQIQTRVLHRAQALGSAIPEGQLADARLAVRQAHTRLLNRQQALSNLGLPISLAEMRALDEDASGRRLRLLGLPKSFLEGKNPDKLPSNLLPLIAPFEGRVVERDTVVGEVVDANKIQLVVADPRRLWCRLSVRLEDSRDLLVGQKIVFDFGDGDPAEGEITWISPGVDKKTRTVRARAEVDNRKGWLKPDTFGTARILVREQLRALAVPNRAIQMDGDVPLIFVLQADGSFEARRVQLGIRGESLTEILSGLRPGEQVVVDGSFVLKSALVRSRLAGGS